MLANGRPKEDLIARVELYATMRGVIAKFAVVLAGFRVQASKATAVIETRDKLFG